MDFRKAFNSIFREGLWHKLINENVRGKFLKIIMSYYSAIKCCVRTKDGLTDFFLTQRGVQQGAVMSPLLFCIYINDLCQNLPSELGIDIGDTSLNCLMYADDLVLFSSDIYGLQELLDRLYDYCNKWKLSVNLLKTKILVCRGGGRISMDEVWFWGDQLIEVCDSYKYLGLIFSACGITNLTLNTLVNQANAALASLKCRVKQIGYVPVDMYLKLFRGCIVPILMYGSGIHGVKNSNIIEKFVLKFYKYLLHVKSSVKHSAILCELGELPPTVMLQYNVIKFWCKLLTGSNTKLSYKMYECVRELAERDDVEPFNCIHWAKEVKQILGMCGMMELWHNTDFVRYNTGEFLSQLFERLCDISRQNVLADLNTSTLYSLYNSFKSNYCMDSYLIKIINGKYRTALSKFRLRSYNLNVVKGHYSNIPMFERLCECCNLNQVEDEYHILYQCPFYLDLRVLYLNDVMRLGQNLNSFCVAMSRIEFQFNISKFVYYAMEKRKMFYNV